MTSVDRYPSTYDCPIIEGGDPVLACLPRARARVEADHTTGYYIKEGGGVCAVGGVLVVEGVGYENTLFGFRRRTSGRRMMGHLEKEGLITATAKAAIALLDEVAAERHPRPSYGHWAGPLEWVNQCWHPFGDGVRRDPGNEAEWILVLVKQEILAIYDVAIERRAAMVEQPGETWPIIEHEREHEPVVPPELVGV